MLKKKNPDYADDKLVDLRKKQKRLGWKLSDTPLEI